MNITEKAMLVKLSISQWTARRFDFKATNRVIASYGAKQNAGRFNKLLIDNPAVKKYQKAASEARMFHYENTLPWGDDEARILPATNYLEYTKRIRELKATFENAVDEFVAEYPTLVERAKIDLNSLFSHEDYPDQYSLRSKFRFSAHVSPVPDSADFRVSLTDDEVGRIKSDIESRVKNSVAEAMKDAWGRLLWVIQNTIDRLGKADAVFRNSLIDNMDKLCDVLPRLNLTDDPKLTQIVKEIKESLVPLDPDELRNDKKARKAATVKAESILKKMSAYTSQ